MRSLEPRRHELTFLCLAAGVVCLSMGCGGASRSPAKDTGSLLDSGRADAPADGARDLFPAPDAGGPAPDAGVELPARVDVPSPPDDVFPAPVSMRAHLLYVREGSPAGGDGQSPEQALGSIVDALAVAGPDTEILVAAGTYSGRLAIAVGSLTLNGAAPEVEGGEPPVKIILQEPVPDAAIVVAKEASDVVLHSLIVAQPSPIGIWVQGGEAKIQGVRVDGARSVKGPQGDRLFGYGVLATDQAGIILQDSRITGSEQIGVFFHEVAPGARVTSNSLMENGQGALRVEVSQDVMVRANTLTGNGEMGVGFFSSTGIILQNTIEDTTTGGPALSADGIIAAELKGADGQGMGPCTLTIGCASGAPDCDPARDGNTISGNVGVGLLFGAGSQGIILQNTVDENGRGGIWLQGGAGGAQGVRVEGNQIRGNSFAGIGITGEGTRGIILQNNASATKKGTSSDFLNGTTFDVGDGIGLYEAASAQIEENEIRGNFRHGILTDKANLTATVFRKNTIEGNEGVGIILQDQGAGPAEFTGGENLISKNKGGDTRRVQPGETKEGLMDEAVNSFDGTRQAAAITPKAR